MKIISVNLENFGSYKELDFDFQNNGLSLVGGPTGSGKSTLCDAIPWVLFGVTAKGGKVDDVLTWPGDDSTKGTLYLENVTVARTRGKQNDLMFWPVDGVVTRGKDLQDTQKLLNQFLGIDADLYLAGSYFHEFSQTAQFFTTTAKNRRLICEQLVDLSLATKLKDGSSELLKTKNKELNVVSQKLEVLKSNIEVLEARQESENTRHKTWEESHKRTIAYVTGLYEKHEKTRHKVIKNVCTTCGTKLSEPKEIYDESENPHLDRLAELELEKNPHTDAAKDYTEVISVSQIEMEVLLETHKKLYSDVDDLEALQLVVQDYRSESIKNTIQYVESETNKLLTKHFDGEIRIKFDIAAADKLDVGIQKDGNEASYFQLSKGQRCMLKLCFGVAVMSAVQNHHGLSFNIAMFDEALDGLSDTLKLKAVAMLETLTQYESIFLVEHSEGVKAFVNNRYNVELVNGASQIEKV